MPTFARPAGDAQSQVASRSSRVRVVALGLLLVLLALAVVACATGSGAGASPSGAASAATAAANASATPSHAATPIPTPLVAAPLKSNPIDFMAWLFTPIFQVLFLILAGLYKITGNVGIAIILLTVLIRAVQIPLFRQQIVSTRRMAMLAPEIKELQRRFKGDRNKTSQAQMELYRERGVNPTAGCLPTMLTLVLLWPMYRVISDGLTNYDPSAMLHVFGTKIIPLDCPRLINGVVEKSLPCITTDVWGFDVGKANILFTVGGFGIGGLALIAAGLQLVQSRMMLTPTAENDAAANTQRTMMYLLPLMTLLWSSFPAGLFLYWIVTTIFSIAQQYLIVGWGSMFPIFGWYPAFARNHTPRFPVDLPAPPPVQPGSVVRRKPEDRATSAANTIRPHTQRGRQGRRGRRR